MPKDTPAYGMFIDGGVWMGLFKSRNTVTRADKIANFTVATAEYGSPVMEILGTTRISGNIIYYDDFTAHEHRETHRTGKGGGSKSTSITYTYTVAVIIGLCEGEIKKLGRVWVDKNIYTYPNSSIQLTLYKGTQEQTPWPYLTSKHPEKALAYPGLAYAAGVIDLGDRGSMPNYNFEVYGKLTETGDGVDVNPADYITYVLEKIGFADKIAGIEDYRSYCEAANLLISTPCDVSEAKAARDIVNEIAELTNAYMFWSNDGFKIVPREDRKIGDWNPDKTIRYDLTLDDFLPQSGGACVSYQRKDSSELYNRFSVEFINRDNGYEKETVSYEDVSDIAVYGVKQAATIKAHYIYTKERAVALAEAVARRNKYERNRYTFKLGWAFCRLEVGDLVTLTDPELGLDKVVVMIDSLTESATGELTFTALSRADGEYAAAEYDVHGVDRPTMDFNAAPGNVTKPVIFQPPSELTTNGNELWLAVKGQNRFWGGCNVWVSDDDEHYTRLGMINNNARIGNIVGDLSDESESLEVKVNGELLTATAQDAQRANTLCWVEGECLSYANSTLLSNGNFLLESLVRGQYNTASAHHSDGSIFVRCDEALLRVNVSKEDIGKKLWLKFTSFNIFGAAEQSMDEVEAYEYTLMEYYLPVVNQLTAHTRYREVIDCAARYDIVVNWQPPNLTTYLEGQVWYKVKAALTDGTEFTEEWLFGGSGLDQVIIPQAVLGDTYRIAVTTKDEFGKSTVPDFAPQIDITIALKTDTPTVPEGFSIFFSDRAVASWQEVTNTDIAFYEVRKDNLPGEATAGMLVRTVSLSAALSLTERKGTLYIYARSAIGEYSSPAVLEYYKAPPAKPSPPEVFTRLGGIGVTALPIPADCNAMMVYINDEAFKSVSHAFSYSCNEGIYTVAVSYVDVFGEGLKSEVNSCVVKAKVDADLIAAEAITADKLDAATKTAIEDAKQAAKDVEGLVGNVYTKTETDNQITSSFAEFKEGELKNYTTITQMNDAIGLAVKDIDIDGNEIITKINMADGSILLDGKYVHVTGDTVIDGNVITGGMLQSGIITTDKLAAQDINLSGALAVVGGAVRLDEKGLKVINANGTYTLFNGEGMAFYDTNNNRFTGIGRFLVGTAKHGQYVRFTQPWDVSPTVIVVPMSLQTNVAEYSQQNIFLKYGAVNITNEGFTVQAFTTLGAGSQGTQLKNEAVITTNSFSGTISGSKTYDVLAGASQCIINISVDYEGIYSEYQMGTGDYAYTRYVICVIDTKVIVYKDDVRVAGIDAIGTVSSGGIIKNLSYTITGLTDTSKIRVEASTWRTNGNTYTGHSHVIVQSLQFNTTAESVVSTGSAMFIATDNINPDYTLE